MCKLLELSSCENPCSKLKFLIFSVQIKYPKYNFMYSIKILHFIFTNLLLIPSTRISEQLAAIKSGLPIPRCNHENLMLLAPCTNLLLLLLLRLFLLCIRINFSLIFKQRGTNFPKLFSSRVSLFHPQLSELNR